jgi:hypothetical protein
MIVIMTPAVRYGTQKNYKRLVFVAQSVQRTGHLKLTYL